VINSVVLVGRIVYDLELERVGAKGTLKCGVRLAVDRGKKGPGQQADFIEVVCWGKTAENLVKYMRKGSTIGVTGELRSHSWQTEGGERRSKLEVWANQVRFMDTRTAAERDKARENAGGPGAMPAAAGEGEGASVWPGVPEDAIAEEPLGEDPEAKEE
jgi:single-strand DNA-binding protein